MKISIITPTFNSQKTIARNITSILNQSYTNFEHVIVDNKSSDNTIAIAKRLYSEHKADERLKIITEKDEGIADAFNKGIKAAEGDIIGILNSDDVYSNSLVFQKVIKAFEESEILFVHGNIYFVDSIYGSNVRKPLLCPVTTAMPYNHPTMFFRKSVYDKYGSFDVSYKYAMDYEFIIRLEKLIIGFREKGRYLTGEPLAVMHAGGVSWYNEIGSIYEIKKALQLHRLWNKNGIVYYLGRIFRTRIKKVITSFGLHSLVNLWRKYKWRG